ncbi:hypothetical protein BN946_scf184952.g6 [Trametes cinnabarina]|uniref:Uncharacterized protein n=1 Tax=Pycnoporus cinnabarinus TaxID=5643 RepID=A0A060T066_PYCCI|nr:hypothetical protein BN946_scf184952.g6 [Trametes cinnabarina]
MSPFNSAYAGRSLTHALVEPTTKAAGQGPEEGCSTIGSGTLPTLMTFSADLLNLTLPITNATHRGCRSQDSENVPTSLPFIDAWDADSEEAKALHDMGIENPDAEQEEEVFRSIPGFDDEWPEEDELPKSDEEERGLESSSCTEVKTGLNNALIDLKGEQCHVTMRGDNVSVLSISKPEIDTNRITKANSESPAVSLYEGSIARFVEGPSRFHIVNKGGNSCAGALDARVQGDSERNLARPVSASKSRSSVLQQVRRK